MKNTIRQIREVLPQFSSKLQINKEFSYEQLTRMPKHLVEEVTARKFGFELGRVMVSKASILHTVGFNFVRHSNSTSMCENVEVSVVAVHPDLWSKIIVLLRELDTDENTD